MQDPNRKANKSKIRGEGECNSRKRVCLYFKNGDGTVHDMNSYTQQQNVIKELINNTPSWQFERMYVGEAGSNVAFTEMMADCYAGKIDIIVTKTIWLFAENIAEAFKAIDRLTGMDPPIEIIFTDEALFTTDSDKLDDLRKSIIGTDDEEKVK